MSGKVFSVMQEEELVLASINPETYMSDSEVRRLFSELERRHDSSGRLGKAVERVRRSVAKAGRK